MSALTRLRATAHGEHGALAAIISRVEERTAVPAGCEPATPLIASGTAWTKRDEDWRLLVARSPGTGDAAQGFRPGAGAEVV